MKLENVNSPTHYCTYDDEVWVLMYKAFGHDKYIAFCQLNSFKYRMRAGLKESSSVEEDIRKAMWYEDKVKQLKKQKSGTESDNLSDNVSSTGGHGHQPEYSIVKNQERKE